MTLKFQFQQVQVGAYDESMQARHIRSLSHTKFHMLNITFSVYQPLPLQNITQQMLLWRKLTKTSKRSYPPPTAYSHCASKYHSFIKKHYARISPEMRTPWKYARLPYRAQHISHTIHTGKGVSIIWEVTHTHAMLASAVSMFKLLCSGLSTNTVSKPDWQTYVA